MAIRVAGGREALVSDADARFPAVAALALTPMMSPRPRGDARHGLRGRWLFA